MFKKLNSSDFNLILKKNNLIKFKNFIVLVEKKENTRFKKIKYGISFYKQNNLKKNYQKKIKRIIYWFLSNKKIYWKKNFIILIKKSPFAQTKKKIFINNLLKKRIVSSK